MTAAQFLGYTDGMFVGALIWFHSRRRSTGDEIAASTLSPNSLGAAR
jgi:hypothetical protein